MIRSLCLAVAGAFLAACGPIARGPAIGPKEAGAPRVLGHGVGRFAIGPLIAKSDFDDPSEWTVQIEEKEGFPPIKVEFGGGQLEVLVPGRGCTIWFNQPLEGPLAIVYEVVCPTGHADMEGVQPRDMNNFWMASGPPGAEDLLDPRHFSGAFGDYDKILCYYASTGGGGAQGNQTTRFRLYPREAQGASAPHLFLSHRDGDPDFLITPGKRHVVQLVAFGDLVQYIVDGEVVYEIRHGDTVPVELPGGGREEAAYTAGNFPVYDRGLFGFRMVATHHAYSRFRVYGLEALD